MIVSKPKTYLPLGRARDLRYQLKHIRRQLARERKTEQKLKEVIKELTEPIEIPKTRGVTNTKLREFFGDLRQREANRAKAMLKQKFRGKNSVIPPLLTQRNTMILKLQQRRPIWAGENTLKSLLTKPSFKKQGALIMQGYPDFYFYALYKHAGPENSAFWGKAWAFLKNVGQKGWEYTKTGYRKYKGLFDTPGVRDFVSSHLNPYTKKVEYIHNLQEHYQNLVKRKQQYEQMVKNPQKGFWGGVKRTIGKVLGTAPESKLNKINKQLEELNAQTKKLKVDLSNPEELKQLEEKAQKWNEGIMRMLPIGVAAAPFAGLGAFAVGKMLFKPATKGLFMYNLARGARWLPVAGAGFGAYMLGRTMGGRRRRDEY